MINTEKLPLRLINSDKYFSFIDKYIKYKGLRFLIKIKFLIVESFINFFILFHLVKKQNPKIVHINNGGYPAALSCRIMVLACKAAGVKKIIFRVNNIATIPKFFLEKLIDKIINKYVDYFVTGSRAAKNKLDVNRSFSEKKLKVIPNTVRFDKRKIKICSKLRDEFQITDDYKIIGSLGLLIERKGYNELIDAVARISPLSKYKVVIFGEGDQRHYLESMIKEKYLSDTVLLPGFRSNVFNYLSDFDIFVLPSIENEDLPNVILEAMYLAKPVLGTNVAGIPEQIVDGVTGFISEPGNPVILAQHLSLMLTMSKEELQEMGARGERRYWERFSNDYVSNKYYSLFRNYQYAI